MTGITARRYYWLNANPQQWDPSQLAVGECQEYTLVNHNGNPRKMSEAFASIQPGDLMFIYVTAPKRHLAYLAEATRGSDGNTIEFEKTCNLETPIKLSQLQKLPAFSNSPIGKNRQGSLYQLDERVFAEVAALIARANPTLPEDVQMLAQTPVLPFDTALLDAWIDRYCTALGHETTQLDGTTHIIPGKYWTKESFKWKAVQNFAENWDIEAHDFVQMIDKTITPLVPIVTSQNSYPTTALKEMAAFDANGIRKAFAVLFDEGLPLAERISSFADRSEEIWHEYRPNEDKRSFQIPTAITAYLWLRYPERYYPYCKSRVATMAKELNGSYTPRNATRKSGYAAVSNAISFLDAVAAYLAQSSRYQETIAHLLGPDDYPDPHAKIAAFDLMYFISTQSDKARHDEPSSSSHDASDFQGDFLEDVADIDEDEGELEENGNAVDIVLPPYTQEDFLREAFMNEGDHRKLRNLVEYRQCVVLKGPPGVGKTFTAKRLAYSILGCEDPKRVATIQFHQSYSYEEFICGFRPTESGGFQVVPGIFYRFCQRAAADLDHKYFLIIDEINRGNLSRIFGEAMMLIEKDYRGETLPLPQGNLHLTVPENLYIIGMMNTADRSLALMDYALRRRFAFFTMSPALGNEKLRSYYDLANNSSAQRLVDAMLSLNNDISQDNSLGRDFMLGHSYFGKPEELTAQRLEQIVEFELIPTLEEYWFEEADKLNEWSSRLREAIR